MESVTISKELFDLLVNSRRELSALHAVGVKDLDVYNGAMHYLGEMYAHMEEDDGLQVSVQE